jgi:endoglucanase
MTGKKLVSLLALAALLTSCSAVTPSAQPSAAATQQETSAPAQTVTPPAAPSPSPSPAPSGPVTMESTGLPLLRGMNLGNMLEAPNEGAWGFTVRKEWFKTIKDAGFDHVRIPICWSAHAGANAPYTIDPDFLNRVDEIVGWALEQNLGVVLDMHNYTEYCNDPNSQRQKLYGIWANLAEHYKGLPQTVVFELLNEPNGSSDIAWNKDAAQLIGFVRKTNPTRWLIVDGPHWANLPNITDLRLPAGDGKLIASVHMYEPLKFTHQGAEWLEGSDAYMGTKWEGTAADKQNVDDLLHIVSLISKKLSVPIYMGEFGAYYKADYESRLRWTGYVARSAEKLGFGWGYWEFCSGFGVYDSVAKKYDSKLLTALIPQT